MEPPEQDSAGWPRPRGPRTGSKPNPDRLLSGTRNSGPASRLVIPTRRHYGRSFSGNSRCIDLSRGKSRLPALRRQPSLFPRESNDDRRRSQREAQLSIDRSSPPSSGLAKPFSFPDFHYQKIGPALEVYSVPWGQSPLVSLELLLPGGGQTDAEGLEGIASLTAGLLDEGTTTRSGATIASTIEQLGGSLGSGADWDSASVSSVSLSNHLSTALELLSDVALRPSFPEHAVDREIARRQAELQRRKTHPSSIADRTLQTALYAGTVYEHPLIGSSSGLARCQPKALDSYFNQQMRGPLQLIAVGGDLVPDQIVEQALNCLPQDSQNTPASPTPVDPAQPHPRVLIVNREGSTQTELRIGHVGVPRSYEDRIALSVMSSLLGGKFTSRINLNLRERNGYTYGARASFSGRKGRGPFVISAAVETPSAGPAALEVLGELNRIRDTEVEPQELSDTVSYLLGVFPYTLQTADGIGARLSQIAIHGLPHDHYKKLPDKLRQVTRSDIQRVARETLMPTQAVVVAVGPAEELRSQFEAVGAVEELEVV